MYTIRTSDNIPDSTYFRSSDVAPGFDGQTITLYAGKGSRRSWGAPQVWSSVVVETDNFVAVHVGFSHKHRGGQQWHYYLDGERVTWQKLSDELRTLVLDNEHKAPRWAKPPGKLRAEHKKPSQRTQIAYKLVKVEGDRMLSLYDGETEYTIGKRLAQRAQDNHGGGYYAYPSAEGTKAAWANETLVPRECRRGVEILALLEVEIGGTVIDYGGKMAATYLTPVKLLETFHA